MFIGQNYFTGYIGVFKGNSSTAIQWDGANNHNNSYIGKWYLKV